MITRVFVSDVHMSLGSSLGAQGGAYDWFDREEAANFADFLATLNGNTLIDEVILLGDIMDEWVYPINVQPPDYQQIVTAEHIKPIIANLASLAANKTVVYVQGNHDISIMNDKYDKFRATFFPNVSFKESYETDDGIYAEHGHKYVMYNAADPRNELPLGHYISRLAATIEARTGQRCRQSEVTGALFPSREPNVNTRTLTGDPLVNLPLSYLANQLDGVNNSTSIIKVGGDNITLGAVRAMYQNLSADWSENHGPMGPLHSIWLEAEGFWGLVQQIAIEKNKKVIIMGHTHSKDNYYLSPPSPVVSPGPDNKPYAVYANCGSWCNYNDPHKQRPYTYVQTEFNEGTGKHTVKLKYWRTTKEDKTEI